MAEAPAREARESEKLMRNTFQLMLNLFIGVWYPFRKDSVVLIDMIIQELNKLKLIMENEEKEKKNG